MTEKNQFKPFRIITASIEDFEENPYFAAATMEEKKKIWQLAKKKIPDTLMNDYWLAVNILCEDELK